MFILGIRKLFSINYSINSKCLLHISHVRSQSQSQSQSQCNDILLTRESNGVRVLTLNNVTKRNVLSLEMLRLLQTNLVDSESLRCIVIEANGPVFCSGHDLKQLQFAPHTNTNTAEHQLSDDKGCHKHIFELCSQVMLTMRALSVPVICVVNGVAAAAGCQLVASTDVAIASENSWFSTPGAKVGLFCSTPGIAISRQTHTKTSAYMLLTGNSITATQAFNAGLLSRVVHQNQLEMEKQNIVNSILSKSKSVLAIGKQFFYDQLDMSLSSAYDNGCRVMTSNLQLYDCQHGIQSFLSKSKPNWCHSNKLIDNQ